MPYKVSVIPGNYEFNIDNDVTLLDAALKQGHTFPYGCRSGKCGMCKGKVVAGSTKYQKEASQMGLDKIDPSQGEVLLCQAYATSDVTVEVREIEREEQIPIRKLPCRVAKMQQLTHDVMQIFLKLPDNERLQFKAGQYIDFLLPNGQRRSFSLANAPTQDEFLELHIRKVEGGMFTSTVFETMHERDILRIEGPLGHFYLRHEKPFPIILVAGGTGFAPVKGIVEQAIIEKIDRYIFIYWGVRSKRDLYMHDLAQQWTEQYDNIRYVPVLSEPLPEDNWQGKTGFVHEAVLKDRPHFINCEVYACGPPPMITAAKKGLMSKGLVEDRFFYDSFEFSH